MHPLDAVLLGAVQGVTEFLPISSDGHLIVVGHFLPGHLAGRDALGFDVLLHAGSLLALLFIYVKTWRRIIVGCLRGQGLEWRLIGLLLLATVPGALVGVFLEDIIANQLRSINAAAWGFLVTAAFLVAGEMVGRHHHLRGKAESLLTPWRAVVLGIAQAVAILPGVSRSGLTISTGRFLGFARTSAVDISFLMAVPIIGGAVSKIALDAWQGQVVFPPLAVSLSGFVSSFIVSCAAIVLFRLIVRVRSVSWFAVYLVPLALLLICAPLAHRLADVTWLTGMVRRYGALVIFLFAVAEVVPPLSFVSPAILVMMIAGSLTPGPGTLLFFIASATAGIVLGNMLLYRIGYFFGPSIGHLLGLHEKRRKRVEEFMQRFGAFNVFLGQFVGLVRPGVAFVAGATRMSAQRYYSWMLASAVLWSVFYILLGHLLHGHLRWACWLLLLAGGLLYLSIILIFGWEVWSSYFGLHRRSKKS